MNKKLLTRLFALLASLVLVLALAVPCFADGLISEESYCLKTITFTDRPSLWAWLTENYSLVQRAVLSVSLAPVPVVYDSINIRYSGDELSNVLFTGFYPLSIEETSVRYMQNYISITDTGAEALLAEKYVTLQDVSDSPSGLSYVLFGDGTPSEIPDAYWEQLGVNVTIYYYDEFTLPVSPETPNEPNTPAEPEAGWYGQVKTIIKNAVFGENTLLNEAQQFTLDQISLWLTLVVILLPLIVGAVILVRCFR